jgi:hypothetical protein
LRQVVFLQLQLGLCSLSSSMARRWSEQSNRRQVPAAGLRWDGTPVSCNTSTTTKPACILFTEASSFQVES